MTTSALLLRSERNTSSLVGLAGLAALAVALAPALTRSIPAPQETLAPVAQAVADAARSVASSEPQGVEETPPAARRPAIEFQSHAAPVLSFKAPPPSASDAANAAYYDQLRTRLRWVPVKVGDAQLRTPDLGSRLLLVKSAAQRAGLHEVGLNHRDIYGIINAETSWIPRDGASKNGTPNLGIAQFEPATARALGLRNPHDPVESVHVAALHLKEAAEWSAKRIASLKLSPQERALKLREGVSIYYNLSSKGRAKWDGTNTQELPRETQLHIANARKGVQHVASIEAQLRNVRAMANAKAESSLALNKPAGTGI